MVNQVRVRAGHARPLADTAASPTLARSKSDLREIGGSVLLCFFAAIDSSGDGKAKSGLKIFVTQKLAAWQRF